MRVSDQNIDRVYISSVERKSTYKMTSNHFHYYFEIYYLRHGQCLFFLNNQQFDLKSGDFLLISPRVVHFNKYLSNCVRVNIYFRAADILDEDKPFLDSLTTRFAQTGVIHIPSSYRATFNQIIDSMVREENVDDKNTALLQKLQLRQFFLYADRYCVFPNENPATSVSQDQEILDAAKYITENYNKPITLEDMAKRASLSVSYFSRKFSATTGMGMKEYLNYTRLSHAALELMSTNHTITEVALNCGFSNSNYFKDAFKKVYGMSPKTYRTSHSTDYKLEQNLIEIGER